MPQMAPLMWLTLFFIFISFFLFFNILNYFNFLKYKNNKINNKMFKSNFLNWKW